MRRRPDGLTIIVGNGYRQSLASPDGQWHAIVLFARLITVADFYDLAATKVATSATTRIASP